MLPAGVDSFTWMQHSWRNRLQSIVLLLVMAGFLMLLGMLLWGRDGIWMMLTVGVVGVLMNPSISPRLVMRLYDARLLAPEQAPDLHDILLALSRRAGLQQVPVLYYIPSSMLNAFAVGNQQQSAIAVTDGLLRQLDRRELTGVLAHEISHVRNNDLWVMGLADMFSRTTSTLSLMGQFLLLLNLPLILLSGVVISWFAILLLVFAPTLSALAQLALSRTREFDADLGAAWLTGDPEGLALALAKIEKIQGGWMERIFLPGRRVPEPSILRTHPDTRERIARLLALKPGPGSDAGLVLPHDAGSTTLPKGLGLPVARPPSWHISGLWH